MTISPHPLPMLEPAGDEWPDEIVDLTDRRRVLVRVVLGVDVPASAADAIFDRSAPDAQLSSTTMRSGGLSSSTDAR